MVKGGRDKKRRSGRTGRTALKNNSFAKYKPPQFTDGVVKKHWDVKKSPAQNLETLGLSSKVNEIDPSLSATKPTEKKSVVELFDIPDSDARTKKSKKLPLGTNDQMYIARCMTKHADNYHKMARDIKINNMQHTEHKLMKMGARFLLLSEEHRRCDVPEQVKHLVV